MKEGIYEQIVNKRIGVELSKLDVEKYDIRLDHLHAEDARRILTIYISEVIRQGMLYIRDSYSSTQDHDSLLSQIKLCNSIVKEVAAHTNEPEFEDNEILEKGEVLTFLHDKMNNVRSIRRQDVIRPSTSIVENVLFTGSRNEPSMLSELKKEIVSSDEIDLLVSFIKWSAIRPLLHDLEVFTERPEARLRIIATTYTRATDYKAIEVLSKLPNTEVRINYDTTHARMHAKSYLFKRNTGFTTAYIGSSNLSNPALTGGLEWNVKVTEKESFDIINKFSVSFESYWNDTSFELFDPEDEGCRRKLQEELSRPFSDGLNTRRLHLEVRPYAFQQDILDNLQAEREVYDHNKNLVVAATGVGKTVIAAFDYKNFRSTHERARLLFVAHRKEILEQGRETFQEVLNDFNFGELYVDGKKPSDFAYLFISIQSFNAAKLSQWTTNDYYDFIIIDEFHHAAAKSYQDLLSYYHPRILLGLTATPDRMDGKDILKYFDGNIASRMLLGEAIDRNLLSPFQYYGLTDSVDYTDVKWVRGKYDVSELERIYSADTRRCALILKSVYHYVTDLTDVKGLGFCVSIAHAEYMAEFFTQKGVPSIALSSDSHDKIRDEAKKKLKEGKIKFVFVVDLYNEGVDIPWVNTILFLRPTESATVFLQQLGRGLRLWDGKECLTVLDFVGRVNKKFNFGMKFEAMLGKGRKSLKKQIEEGFANIPRGCYIELERQAKEYILENLNQSDNTKRSLIEKIRVFEEDTGMELNLQNFLTEHHLSLYELYKNNGERSMHRFKQWAGITSDKRDVDDKIYSAFTGLFHVNSKSLLDYWILLVSERARVNTNMEILMQNMLYYTFYKKCPRKEGFNSIEDGIRSFLKEDFVREEIQEILRYNRSKIELISKPNDYPYDCPLEIHSMYNINQILAGFGYYNEAESPEFREGVKYFEEKRTDIFLVNLNKSEKDFSPSTMYEDYAISERLFHWQSQSQDRVASTKIQRYMHHKETGNMISLFVREYKRNGTYTAPYMFLGNAEYIRHEGERPVSFIWKMKTPIPATLLPKANKSIAV